MQQNINLRAQINNQSAFQTIPNQNNVNTQGYNMPIQGMQNQMPKMTNQVNSQILNNQMPYQNQNFNQQINRIDTL